MQLNNDLNNMQIYCDESGFTENKLLDVDHNQYLHLLL